jgi:hypothetical protein
MARNTLLMLSLMLLAGCSGQKSEPMTKATVSSGVATPSTVGDETLAERQATEGINRIAATTRGISTPLQTLVDLPKINIGFDEIRHELLDPIRAGNNKFGDEKPLRSYVERLESKVRSRLDQSNIQILENQDIIEKKEDLGVLQFARSMAKLWLAPTLDLELRTLHRKDDSYAYTCDLVLKEHVELSRKPSLKSQCAVWRATAVIGIAADRKALFEAVEEYTLRSINQFIRDVKDANNPEFMRPFDKP